MATFAYGRVSAKDETAEKQRRDIEAAGYRVDCWFADEGVSGKVSASQRPQFKSLLDEIRDGERLVVGKLDSLGCDAQDVLVTVNALSGRRIALVVLQLGNTDLTSAAGQPMLSMLAAVAEMERDPLGERTQTSMAKAEGKTPGRPSRTTEEQRASIITDYSTGVSISELARRYKLSRASILRIVNPKNLPEEPLRAAWGD